MKIYQSSQASKTVVFIPFSGPSLSQQPLKTWNSWDKNLNSTLHRKSSALGHILQNRQHIYLLRLFKLACLKSALIPSPHTAAILITVLPWPVHAYPGCQPGQCLFQKCPVKLFPHPMASQGCRKSLPDLALSALPAAGLLRSLH